MEPNGRRKKKTQERAWSRVSADGGGQIEKRIAAMLPRVAARLPLPKTNYNYVKSIAEGVENHNPAVLFMNVFTEMSKMSDVVGNLHWSLLLGRILGLVKTFVTIGFLII